MAEGSACQPGRGSRIHRAEQPCRGRACRAEDSASRESAKEESSDGPGGASCGDARAGRGRNSVHHSLPGSRRGGGNLASVSRCAEVAGEVLKVEKPRKTIEGIHLQGGPVGHPATRCD